MFFIRTASAADPRGRLLDGRRARLSDLFCGRLLGLLQELTDGYLQFGLIHLSPAFRLWPDTLRLPNSRL